MRSCSITKPGAALRALCMCVVLLPGWSLGQQRYQLGWRRDAALVGAGLGLNGIALLQAQRPLPALTVPLDPAAVNGVDRLALGRWDPASHTASNVLFGVGVGVSLASAMLVYKDDGPMVPAALILESSLLTAGITNVVKELVKRPRPYLYEPGIPAELLAGRDDRHSFWSGHTANMAAISFTTAFLVQGSEASAAVKTTTWIGAATVPAAMGWLRVRSGRHFPTDVLTGYAIGAFVGWAVPYIHRLNSGTNKR